MTPTAHDAPSPPDDRVWQLLADFSRLDPADLGAARVWWQAAARPGEPAAEFLVRQGVLLPRAARELDVIRKGYVAPSDLTRLYAPGAADRIRQAAAAEPILGDPAEAADTDTVSRVFPVPFAGAALSAGRSTECDDETDTPSAQPAPQPIRASAEPNPVACADVGQVLGRCVLTERVGEGGSGLVFRAVHQSLNIPVAVKVLKLDGRQAVVRSQVRHEAQLLARLNHPHVVRVWDFDDAGPAPYLVLEWVDGPSLGELIRQSGRLPADRAVRVVSQAAAGLAEAHRLGIVHRDVKPGNILLTRGGTAKLADLGTAVAGRAAAAGVAGTVAYMAPELFRGAPPGPPSDVYSLGVTLYQALTGGLPFGAGTALEVMVRHASEAPVPPDRKVDGVPTAVSAAVLRALAKDPADRFGSCREFVDALADPVPVAAAAPPSATEPVTTTVRAAGPGSGVIRAVWKSVFGGGA